MKDVSFDGMAEPGTDLGAGLAGPAASARASSSTSGGSVRDLVLGDAARLD